MLLRAFCKKNKVDPKVENLPAWADIDITFLQVPDLRGLMRTSALFDCSSTKPSTLKSNSPVDRQVHSLAVDYRVTTWKALKKLSIGWAPEICSVLAVSFPTILFLCGDSWRGEMYNKNVTLRAELYSRWKVMLTLHLILPLPPATPSTFPPPPPNICFLVPKCLAQLHFLTLHPHTPHNLLPSDYIPCYTLSFLPYVHPSSSYSWPELSPHSSLPSFPYIPSKYCM